MYTPYTLNCTELPCAEYYPVRAPTHCLCALLQQPSLQQTSAARSARFHSVRLWLSW